MTNVYEDDEEQEDEIGPGSSDYDLSEEHGYEFSDSEDRDDTAVVPRWAMVVVTITVVAALVLPAVLLIWRYG